MTRTFREDASFGAGILSLISITYLPSASLSADFIDHIKRHEIIEDDGRKPLSH
jgi:hypothetical protein